MAQHTTTAPQDFLSRFGKIPAKETENSSLKRQAEEIPNEETLKFQAPSKVTLLQVTSPFNDPDNENTVNYSSVFKRTRRIPSNSREKEANSLEKKEVQSFRAPASQAKSKESESSVTSCRERFGALLPQYLSMKLPKQLIHLVEIAKLIDELLSEKVKVTQGEFWSEIKFKLNQNFDKNIELADLQRILYLQPDYYIIRRQSTDHNQNTQDIKIWLPKIKKDLVLRKILLRKSVFDFVIDKHKGFAKQNGMEIVPGNETVWLQGFDVSSISIPLFSFPFEFEDPLLPQTRRNYFATRPASERDRSISFIDPSRRIQSSAGKSTPQEFREKLLGIVAEKEKSLKEEAKSEVQEISCENALLLIEQVNNIYKQRGLNNMFAVTIIDQIAKKLPFSISKKSIQTIIERTENTGVGFFKSLSNPKGKILQIDRNRLDRAKEVLREVYDALGSK